MAWGYRQVRGSLRYGTGRGIRQQQWKASRRHNQPWQLFDIENDPGETNDLSKVHPERLQALIDDWTVWSQGFNDEPSEHVAQGL